MKNHQIVLLCLAALLPGSLPAQSENEAEAPPLYDVEVVIFKNVKAPRSREFVLPVTSPSRDEKLFDLSSAASVAAASKLGYQALPADEFRLLEIAGRLAESERYELLLHAAWRQPGVEREQALPVWLRGGRIYGPEYTSIDNRIDVTAGVPGSAGADSGDATNYAFDAQTLKAQEQQMLEQKNARGQQSLYEFEGKITIALGRYLHAYTDLVFRRPRLSIDPVTGERLGAADPRDPDAVAVGH